MQDDPKLKTLLAEIEASVRRYIEAAFRETVDEAVRKAMEQQRARVLKVFQDEGTTDQTIVPPPVPAAGHPKTERPSPAASAEYGAVSAPIRKALTELRPGPNGVTAADVQEYCRKEFGADVTVEQVRNILKVFARRGDAIRRSRGHYAPGPKLAAADSTAPSNIHRLVNQEARSQDQDFLTSSKRALEL